MNDLNEACDLLSSNQEVEEEIQYSASMEELVVVYNPLLVQGQLHGTNAVYSSQVMEEEKNETFLELPVVRKVEGV